MTPTKPKPRLIIAFDLYGTILSTSSISSDLANHFGPDKADLIATKWRQYQLEYTWRLTAMAGDTPYLPFDRVTRAALIHAVNEAGLHIPDAKADELLQAYDSLIAFEDVLPALQALQQESSSHAEAVVFSNGTPQMLARSVATSPTLKLFHQDGGDAAGRKGVFRKLISVDPLGKYKPARDVYEFLQREAAGEGAGYKAQAAVWLVSANPFDVVGARAAGLRAVWVDRTGTGWVDRLGDVIAEAGDAKQRQRQPDLKPTLVVKGVDEAVAKILEVGV